MAMTIDVFALMASTFEHQPAPAAEWNFVVKGIASPRC